MARLLTCGWETGGVTEMNGPRNNAVVSSSKKRTGEYGVALRSGGLGSPYARHVFDANKTTIYGRVAFQLPNAALENTHKILSFEDEESTYFLGLYLNTDVQLLELHDDDDATLAQGFAVLATDAWYVLEWKLIIHASTGQFTWKVNNVTDGTFIGNTQQGGTGNLRTFGLAARGDLVADTSMYYDDLAINDEAGSFQNSWIGLGGIYLLMPTADTATVEWAPSAGTVHYDKVDERPANTTDWVQGTAGQKEYLTMAACPEYTAQIDVVQVVCQAGVIVSGSQQLTDVVVQGGTEYPGGTVEVVNIAPAYQVYKGTPRYEQPNGDGAWDVTSVNALAAGFMIPA